MIIFVSNADSELLAVRSVVDALPDGFPPVTWINPNRLATDIDLDRQRIVVVRLLGGRRSWEKPFDRLRATCLERGVALVAVGGEATPDPELMGRSTVPAGVAAEAHRYLAAGDPANIEHLLRFLADTLLMTGHGFDPPMDIPDHGVWGGAGLGRPGAARRPGRPLIAVVFYRAHLVAGNVTYVADLCDAIETAGADALAVYTYSLRADAAGAVPALELCRRWGADVIVTSTLAAGVSDGDDWIVPDLAGLGIPVIQAPSSSRSREVWQDESAGLAPIDVGMGVAIPEFDGRIIGPTYAFKQVVEDTDHNATSIVVTRSDRERAARLAGLAVRHARLRHKPAAEKRVALVLSAYPTKRSRLGNAVGLDTPASVICLLRALKERGYRVDRIPEDGDRLMAELADGLVYDTPRLSPVQVASAAGSLPVETYLEWFRRLPADTIQSVETLWGPAPGDVYLDDGRLVFPGLDLGGVLVTIQPPRGFGEDQISTYHAPDVPPPHHYLAFYRWLATPRHEGGWDAEAVVHVGKHGTLEWLPGKALALSAGCFPDAALGDLPFVYPFVVNDPGEGTQAKRRTHAVIVDHLPPPLTRADTYDELARLEQLLDTYARIEAMDPAKLPAVRSEIWQLLVEAEIHRDLQLEEAEPGEEDFADLVLHVDGYLCELKDAQIRGGLHILGRPPEDEHLIDTVLAVTRLPQGSTPSLRATVASRLGIDLATANRTEIDRIEAECRRLVEGLAEAGWRGDDVDDSTLRWISLTLVPALRRTTDEIDGVLAALEGRYVPAGPSGAPSRGAAHVLPTGRNFYSVDPKSIPTPFAWEVGNTLADRLVARHLEEEGSAPRTVGLVLWGTAAMRTGGDDVAEALALLGVKPVWDPESQLVRGLSVIPPEELGRPRVDVTLRISGFFRDAFPHVIALLDDAVRMVADLDEDPERNPVAAGGAEDPRIFGPPPGGYGSGILPLIQQQAWRTDADLAEVYLAWSGFAYGRDRFGVEAPEAMRRRFAAIDVAVKNQDNREHDIFDSDDYLQDHGGMIAAVRMLTGSAPHAWFGDTSDPSNPRVRTLAEEAARVVRSRVLNPRWISAMQQHGYKGAFELVATVDYLFGYDATARVVEDWMYQRVTEAYVSDPAMRKFFQESNPWALRSISERLLEAHQRGMWDTDTQTVQTLRQALLEAEGWEEDR